MNNSTINKLMNNIKDYYPVIDKAGTITKAGECSTRQMTEAEKEKYGEPAAKVIKNKAYGMWPRAKKGA